MIGQSALRSGSIYFNGYILPTTCEETSFNSISILDFLPTVVIRTISLSLQARFVFCRNSCGTHLSLADDGSHKVDANGLTKAQNEMIDEVLGALQPALRDESGLWTADYVRLKFRAHLPYGRCIE